MRIPERLRPLVEDGLVQEVVQPLMSGKEASLFVVHAGGDYCVAKVYKDAQHRSFRHRAGYMEGRRVRNSRQRRAMEKGTRYGKRQMEEAWQNAEVDALYRLAEAGVRVPRPQQYVDGVLLMEVILDPDGNAAPRLFDVDLTPEEALDIHAFLIRQIVLMLCAGLVHGDLSECNVLLAWDGPVIIDLPQATDAAHNPNAMTLFLRDVENLTRYLARFAPELARTRYGPEIWNLYQRGELHPDSPLTGRFQGSSRKANTRAVLDEIEDAAREAMRMRAAQGDDRPLEGRRDRQAAREQSRGQPGRGSEARSQGSGRGQGRGQDRGQDRGQSRGQGRERSAEGQDRQGADRQKPHGRAQEPRQERAREHKPQERRTEQRPRGQDKPQDRPERPRQRERERDKPAERSPPRAEASAAPAPQSLDGDDLDAYLISEPSQRHRR